MSKITNKEFNEAVGRIIKAERTLAELTQAQLAKMIGVSKQLVEKYETGSTGISAYSLVRIAEALGLEPSKLLTGNFIMVGDANG